MNSFSRQMMDLEKLKKNKQRRIYLKKIAYFCLIVDFLAYLGFETLDFSFSLEKFNESNFYCYISKVRTHYITLGMSFCIHCGTIINQLIQR
jgi:hypothetical protein